jgi:hypothetical protein
MPPLSKICSSISNSDAHIREAEVLVCALIEELDEIADDIHLGKMPAKTGENLEKNTTQLDGQLKDLLKKFEGQNFEVTPCYHLHTILFRQV